MKKKIAIIILAIVILLPLARCIGIDAKYAVPNKKYFGEQYGEIFKFISAEDKEVAEEILIQLDTAFAFIGSKEEAQSRFGDLSRYCANENVAKETHSIDLVAASFGDTDGYLWFEYTRHTFDEKGDEIGGSMNILVRLTLEKSTDGWKVVKCKEAP